jgi:hypothetical protein
MAAYLRRLAGAVPRSGSPSAPDPAHHPGTAANAGPSPAQLTDTFKALSADALQRNSHSFMQLAETLLGKFQTQAQGDLSQRQQAIATLVQPLQTSLERVDSRLQELETARVAAYSGLTEQVKALALAQSQLQGETANLVKALRSPTVRGRWGGNSAPAGGGTGGHGGLLRLQPANHRPV